MEQPAKWLLPPSQLEGATGTGHRCSWPQISTPSQKSTSPAPRATGPTAGSKSEMCARVGPRIVEQIVAMGYDKVELPTASGDSGSPFSTTGTSGIQDPEHDWLDMPENHCYKSPKQRGVAPPTASTMDELQGSGVLDDQEEQDSDDDKSDWSAIGQAPTVDALPMPWDTESSGEDSFTPPWGRRVIASRCWYQGGRLTPVSEASVRSQSESPPQTAFDVSVLGSPCPSAGMLGRGSAEDDLLGMLERHCYNMSFTRPRGAAMSAPSPEELLRGFGSSKQEEESDDGDDKSDRVTTFFRNLQSTTIGQAQTADALPMQWDHAGCNTFQLHKEASSFPAEGLVETANGSSCLGLTQSRFHVSVDAAVSQPHWPPSWRASHARDRGCEVEPGAYIARMDELRGDMSRKSAVMALATLLFEDNLIGP